MVRSFFRKGRAARRRITCVALERAIAVTTWYMASDPTVGASPQRGSDGKFRNPVAKTPRGFWGEVRLMASFANRPDGRVPDLEGVVISHDHYDHLDHASIVALAPKVKHFLTPQGLGDRLIAWGVPAHIDLRGRRLLPFHNGTFDLAMHSWQDPFKRVMAAARHPRIDTHHGGIGEHRRANAHACLVGTAPRIGASAPDHVSAAVRGDAMTPAIHPQFLISGLSTRERAKPLNELSP